MLAAQTTIFPGCFNPDQQCVLGFLSEDRVDSAMLPGPRNNCGLSKRRFDDRSLCYHASSLVVRTSRVLDHSSNLNLLGFLGGWVCHIRELPREETYLRGTSSSPSLAQSSLPHDCHNWSAAHLICSFSPELFLSAAAGFPLPEISMPLRQASHHDSAEFAVEQLI